MQVNELHAATSPYLLQHKENPVHWKQWGPRALEEARRMNRPILLSIGYAACHWCHVMAHESFENAAVAAVMNELFVNIKVDREERPDIDQIYMGALHALGEQGGWPLTMFLTPDGDPFWGGTYFPTPARYGRLAFADVCTQIAAIFHREPDRIARNATALRSALQRAPVAASAAPLTLDWVDGVAARLAEAIDPIHGGLAGAPKFPNVGLLELLLRAADRDDTGRFHALAVHSLERMCQGGIFDHLGGGFSRYSVDERWLAPHFEKMLYDNAQLLELLASAFERTRDPLFEARAVETVAWLRREMTTPQGAFCASLDADSEGVEGKFYVWSMAEVVDVLGPARATRFAAVYDVSPDGNWVEAHGGEHATILNRLTPPSEPTDEIALAADRDALLARRASRPRPALDDKVLADWNGLMIAALADAARVFARPDWLRLARRAYAFVRTTMAAEPSGAALGHSWRDGRLLGRAFASDYAAMIKAALALLEHDPATDGARLDDALAWTQILLNAYRVDDGLLATTPAGATDIIVRLAPTVDDATPNPNGVFAACLIRLAGVTGDERWRAAADALIEAARASISAQPLAHAALINALELRLAGAQVTLIGPHDPVLEAAAYALPFLARTITRRAAAGESPDAAAAILCFGSRCLTPIEQASQIRAQFDDVRRSGDR